MAQMAQIGCLKAYLINKLNSRAKSPKSVSFAALASKYASCLPSRVQIEQKDEVLHLFRFICLSILTLIIMTASLATDNLAFWSKQRSCSNAECSVDTSKGGCSGYCGDYHHTNDTYEHPPECIAHGKCGWRTGKTSYTQPSDSDSNFCPSCQGDSCVYSNTMYDDWDRISWDPHNQNNGPRAGVYWDSVYNFENLCALYGDEAACTAMRFGNVYIALTLFAIGFNVFTVCLMTSCMLISFTLSFLTDFVSLVWICLLVAILCESQFITADQAHVTATTSVNGHCAVIKHGGDIARAHCYL